MAVLPVGIGPETSYNISRSLRFNSADSAYLNRTPASAGNRKTWTWSGWVKRSALGSSQPIIFADAGSNTNMHIRFNSTDTMQFFQQVSGVDTFSIVTTQVFRDISAWLHVVAVLDTSQATSTNRVKLYVNGTQITAFSSTLYPSQNYDGTWNSNVTHQMGAWVSAPQYLNGYLTEVNFIDGQALTPSSFGETDAITGVWKPKKYTGTYGTNGFYLNFSDNSGTTATTLGKDYSGNGNNWTPNNFSVTAGAGNDSLVDVPTLWGSDTGAGGEVRGNYCTLNPLDGLNTAGALLGVFSNGNLDFSVAGSTGNSPRMNAVSTIYFPSSGKWYAEFTNISNRSVGIVAGSVNQAGVPFTKYITVTSGGRDFYDGSITSGAAASFTTSDVIGVAYDIDNATVKFYKNGVEFIAFGSVTTSTAYCFGSHHQASGTAGTFLANFGQRAWANTAPSGFKALCTTNLPEPTIKQGDDYFNAVLYTGNGSTQSITGVGFQPDWVWVKKRSGAENHELVDVLRTPSKRLASNTTDAESTGGFTSFNSDGFTLAGGYGTDNENAQTYVAWNWKANGAGVTNTAGTITSTVSANTTAGFSIVTWTQGVVGTDTVGHGLGVKPAMVIHKRRGTTSDWTVWHQALDANPNNYYLLVNSTAAKAGSTNWENPTSTTIKPAIGSTGDTYVAYCFSEVAGFSKFGGYTGNGSTDGPFVFTNMRPKWILLKRTDSTSGWLVIDTVRQTYNVLGPYLLANTSNAETTGTTVFDALSNGFKMRSATTLNDNGATYVYAAFAEFPFKTALAR